MLRRLKIGGMVTTCCAIAMSCVGNPPDPARPALVSCTQATWETMTPRERVGQLFLLGVPANSADGQTSTIERLAPGGVFLIGRSTAGVAATAVTTGAIQQRGTSASGGVGMFVATDQEGGQVQVLSGPGFSQIPSAKVQGGWKPEVLQAAATGWGQELRAAGVNVDLAPVADVLSPELGSANAAIGRYDRAYGTDPEVVATHVLAFARGMGEAGVVSTVKHFPGLGRVRDNTDFSSGVVDEQTTAIDPDLLPFSRASQAGTPWMMVSSAIYSRIDAQQPASFSAAIITTLLREKIGYRGLVVSDDLGRAKQVAAVPAGQRAVRFLRAGGDIVLTADPTTLEPMIDEVLSTATSDPEFAGRITESQRRILEAKTRLGLLPCGRS
jgi:beta-N-acetylhexosaminidase